MTRAKTILFYALSFTWGLPVSLAGLLAAGFLRLRGVRPHRFGPCLHFETGKSWGGLSLGPFLFTERDPHPAILFHELGHSLQNCLFGLLTPLLITLPSAARYWTRHFRPSPKPYDGIWFERQATRWGSRFQK